MLRVSKQKKAPFLKACKTKPFTEKLFFLYHLGNSEKVMRNLRHQLV